MKKVLLLFTVTFVIFSANAQQKEKQKFQTKGFHFAGGVNVAFSFPDIIGDIPNPWGIGVELQPEFTLTRRIALYGSTGYTNFFNKVYYPETSHFKTYNVGFVPVLAGAKVYIIPELFIGCKAGVAFINSEKDVQFLNNYPTQKAAFNIQPQVGYMQNKFQCNFVVNVFAKNDVHFSAGILYNFK